MRGEGEEETQDLGLYITWRRGGWRGEHWALFIQHSVATGAGLEVLLAAAAFEKGPHEHDAAEEELRAGVPMQEQAEAGAQCLSRHFFPGLPNGPSGWVVVGLLMELSLGAL